MKTELIALPAALCAVVLSAVLFAACGSSNGTSSSSGSAKSQTIAQFPAGSTPVTTPSGLQYVDLVVGAGPTPVRGQQVSVHYTGWLTNGSKFDSSRDGGRPYRFALGRREVIQGWDEAIATMQVGGKRKLIVPPSLAYGSSAMGGGLIPANSTLVFEVELVAIE